jgi:signal transduction histidine kinase
LDLTDLVGKTLAELLPLASGKQIEMSLDADLSIVIEGNHRALHALIANLVDNAIKYTPAGGKVSVSLTPAGNQSAELRVVDTGPGIPIEHRELVLDRFYRIPGSAAVGSGLGLAIAAAVVQQHRGMLMLSDAPSGGLCVTVTLPCSNAADRAAA